MKFYPLVLLLVVLGYPVSDLTVQGNMRVKGGRAHLGSSSMLPNVGLNINSSLLTDTVQIGAYVAPGLGGSVGDEGLRVRPSIRAFTGHVPVFMSVHIYPPVIGAGAGAKRIYGIYMENQVGSDSGNGGIYTNLGPNSLGDTTYFRRLVQFNAGINYHGRVVSSSQRVTDSDYVVLVDISSGRVVDTLPTLASSIGREYVFIQYSTAAAGNFTIKPWAGEKIETYDSLNMRSNIGISKIILLNTSTKWSILYQHEEGTFAAVLTGVSGTVTDTGFYTRDNLNLLVRIKPLIGTSNATSFTITGADTRFCTTGTDTTYTGEAMVGGYNAGVKVAADCGMLHSTGIISCENVSTGYAAWTATGIKGLRFGINISTKLKTQPSY